MRTDNGDDDEVARLGAPPWMVEALRLNPSYPYWGNHEDYMIGSDAGWRSPVEVHGVDHIWPQDEMNEIVHGYFFIDRNREKCGACGQSGYNPATHKIADDWYGSRDPRDRWCDKITQDEVDALLREGRLWRLTNVNAFVNEEGVWVHHDRELQKTVPYTGPIPTLTAEEVNQWERGGGMGHDAINRHICIEQRAKRLGVYGKCAVCEGHGYVFTEEKPRLALQLWVIHPRKGASRGLIVRNVAQGEIPIVQAYFKTAIDRTIARFSKLAGL